MRLKNGLYQLSATDLKRAAAHTRSLARKAAGRRNTFTECWFDAKSGLLHYAQDVGIGYRMKGEHAELICSVYNRKEICHG